jgi:hypothetical protein
VEISQSSASSVGATADRPVQGRIESVKDGVATVRVSNTVVVQASVEGRAADFQPGTRVALFADVNGKLVAKSVATVASDAQNATMQALMDSLGALLGENTAATLSKSLASGDLDAARKQIAEIWQALKGAPAQRVPAQLKAWVDQKAPAMLSRPGDAPVVPGGSVALTLGAATSQEGEYFAQVAGQPAKLLGPSDLAQGPKGLWQSRPVPGGGAVWAPAGAVRTEAARPLLPERVPANAEGATALLEWAGVEASPEARDSLGQFLAHVAEDFGAVEEPGQATSTWQTSAQRLEKSNFVAGATVQGSAMPGDVVAEAKEKLGQLAARPTGPEQVMSESVVPERGLPQVADRPVLAAEAAVPARSKPEVLQLPRAVAERALVAWAKELPDEPSVRRAVVGSGPNLPEAVAGLSEIVASEPGKQTALQAVLAEWADKGWAEPAGLKAHKQNLSLRERMAEALFEALSKTDLSADSAPLRQALQQAAQAMVKETLEPPRETNLGYPPAVFQARNTEGAMEEGRIVVHDRRSKKRDQAAPTDHHTVEIEMRPAALGHIKAKLDLRGKVLTTLFEAKEADTATLIESRVHELREAFKKMGLEPAKIEVERPASASRIDPRKRGSGASLDLRV